MRNKFLYVLVSVGLVFIISGTAKAEVSYNLRGQMFYEIKAESEQFCPRPTITLLNSDKTAALYVNEGTTEKSQESYIMEFESFKIPHSVQSGTLYLKIGGKNITTEIVPVDYKAPDDIYDALNNHLNVSDASDIHLQMQQYGEIAGADLSQYNVMPLEWYSEIDTAVLALDLSVAEDHTNLYEKQEAFLNVIDKISNQYIIAQSQDRTQAVALLKQSDSMDFDRNKFFDIVDVDTVAEYIKESNIPASDAERMILYYFDEGIFIQCVDVKDWKTAEQALVYYANKGRFNCDFSKYNSLSDLNKEEVIEYLKSAKALNFNNAAELLGQGIAALQNNNSSGGNHSSISGGGGGSYTGGSGIVSPVNETVYSSSSLKDLDIVPWAKGAIEKLYNKNIVSGFEDGNYYPENNVTREQFIKTVVAAFGIAASNSNVEFNDVDGSAWYSRYVAAAYHYGIVSGISGNEFGVGSNITREDMAVIICNILIKKGIEPEQVDIKFTDADDISDYAKTAVGFLADKGIINGMGGGNFEPKGNVTRAQMAVMICNVLDTYQNVLQ